MTSAVLAQGLLTDHRARTVMCSSLPRTPCRRLPSTHAGRPARADPSCLRPSAAASPRVTHHPSSSAVSQPSPTPSATELSLILCLANTMLFLSHHPSSQKAQGSLQLLTPPVPVLKVPLRGNMLLPLDATQSRTGAVQERRSHVFPRAPCAAPGKPTGVVHLTCSCPSQAFNGSMCTPAGPKVPLRGSPGPAFWMLPGQPDLTRAEEAPA